MQIERLIVLENTSKEDIRDMWDSVPYVFPAGKRSTLRYGVGLQFTSRHPELVGVGEERGRAPETIAREVRLVNPGTQPLELAWDGVPYVFPPAKPQTVDGDLAAALIESARRRGGQLQYVPEKPEAKPTEAPDQAAPETTPKRQPSTKRGKAQEDAAGEK